MICKMFRNIIRYGRKSKKIDVNVYTSFICFCLNQQQSTKSQLIVSTVPASGGKPKLPRNYWWASSADWLAGAHQDKSDQRCQLPRNYSAGRWWWSVDLQRDKTDPSIRLWCQSPVDSASGRMSSPALTLSSLFALALAAPAPQGRFSN